MRSEQKKDNSENIIAAVTKAMADNKGKDIISLNLKDLNSTVTDYFVICHATSRTQVENLGDKIMETVRKEAGEKPYHFEGYENAEWILIDYINVVVHVFLEPLRDFYKLESLWADAERISYSDDE